MVSSKLLMSESSTDDYQQYSPHPSSLTMAQWLEESNQITRHILQNLQAGEESVPQLEILNPPLWEFGHLTWFHEFWVHRQGQVSNPSSMMDADYLFNSSDIAHQDRWSTTMPCLNSLLDYNQDVVEKTQQLFRSPIDEKTAYFIQLAIFHQDMHNEAFAYMWQTLGYSMPFVPFMPSTPSTNISTYSDQAQTWIHFPQSTINVGSDPHSGFIFDNEKWAYPFNIPAFNISSKPVSNADYLVFLESKGNLSELQPVAPPPHWKKIKGVWFERSFNQWLPLNPTSAVRHINCLDAQRFCYLNQVRLPSEHELSVLMSQKPILWQPSHLWEWTSSPFAPFPGFTPDPYTDYSQPWFDGSYQVLKGGGPFTPERLKRTAFRNFYQRNRGDLFCGFRTCSL
jgi:iron(II)-dependent oxidoreductase